MSNSADTSSATCVNSSKANRRSTSNNLNHTSSNGIRTKNGVANHHEINPSLPVAIDWSKQDADLLRRYRSTYRLLVPVCFSSPSTQIQLSVSRYGRLSQTMLYSSRNRSSLFQNSNFDSCDKYSSQSGRFGAATNFTRASHRPLVSQKFLARAIKRHFNALPIYEIDVMAEFFLKIRYSSKALKLYVSPTRRR